jgi:hypothetical protein
MRFVMQRNQTVRDVPEKVDVLRAATLAGGDIEPAGAEKRKSSTGQIRSANSVGRAHALILIFPMNGLRADAQPSPEILSLSRHNARCWRGREPV